MIRFETTPVQFNAIINLALDPYKHTYRKKEGINKILASKLWSMIFKYHTFTQVEVHIVVNVQRVRLLAITSVITLFLHPVVRTSFL